ncbi:hypothetical protein KI387_033121, partial [Taxus chinensis]
IATPTAEKTKEDITVTDYHITRVDLGKLTTEGAQHDAQDYHERALPNAERNK